MNETEEAIVTVARLPVEDAFGADVKLKVDTLNVEGRWAFVLAKMSGVDLAKTSFAEAAREGLLSNQYAALLTKRQKRWELVDSIIGPTDPAWLSWVDTHEVPQKLFETRDA
ncbi:MAG: hypothetical protein DI536_33220 [Archangium gephyra]|uniref:Uncharacterized protein n=1 Tax=Archangium gephyra TaxID=48 RepID=A0A2W5SQN4_9BACT|nr:MAG: hypothetical protein DI536_33220 [Archangium gephyra]